jgi:ribonuclease HII
MVVARQESAARSVYEVLGLPRRITLCFQPRADGTHATVALASMAAKYLRERSMQEFNTYFQKHLPGLEPTAGYPVDAGRFLDTIRPLLPGLNLTVEALWRKK